VAKLHCILVEDAVARSELVSRFLARAGLPNTHLHVPTPRRYKRPGLPRATEQRNAGLAWLRQRHQHQRAQPGVLFFADDDNTYSLELFQEVAAGPPPWGQGREGPGAGWAKAALAVRFGCTLEFPVFGARIGLSAEPLLAGSPQLCGVVQGVRTGVACGDGVCPGFSGTKIGPRK
jgi:hypothetical protein